MRKPCLILSMLFLSLLLSACGGSGSTAPPIPSVTHFSVSAPTPAVAGVPFQITVTALDVSGNVVTSFNAVVTLTSSDAQAVLLPIGLVAGTGTGSITLQTPGSQTIVAHYNSISSTSNPITVNASGPVASFMLSTPGTAVIGSPIQFTVTAIDSNGLTVTSYSGTVKFSSSDPLAHLPGNSPLTSGTGNFSATMGTSGNATISATDTSSARLTGVSNSIGVSGPATHYSFNNVPANIYTRVQFTVGITALDASNNLATSYSGAPQLKSTDSAAILPSTATLANGVGSVNVVFESPGNQTITATDSAKSTLTAASSTIAVAAVPALVVSSAPPPTATVGSNYYPHVVRVCLQYRMDPIPVCIRYGYKTVYGYPLVASGGVAGYSWSWAAAPSSSLPPAFSLKNNDITGTPPVGSVGNYQIIVTVTDSGTPPVNTPTPYTFTIQNPPPPVINSALLPPGATLNQPYSFTFAATQGLAPYSWSETGPLPASIAFSSSGVLSGTPSAAGSSSITVNVEDSLQQKTTTPLQVTLQVSADGFHSAASMKSPRVQHTATLLANGKVLVTGGDNTSPSTGELYDPSADTFTSVGNMSAAFDSHTATLLCDLSHLPCANDKVLIAGGSTSSAELFDPSTSEFTPIADTLAQRMAATATLLPNGKVLLAGGTTVTTSNTPGVVLSSAELFDPSALTFVYTGTMVSARQNYTATLLSDGKVLLVGGSDGSNALASAELFDPSNNSFAPSAGSLHTARWSHTATPLPNGKVFITGGWDSTNQALASAELYDPSTDSFSDITAPMITPRVDFTSTLLSNGTVLIVGGHDRNNNVFGNVEIFDPSSATFTSTGGLSTARYFHTATLLPGTAGVLVTGGYQKVSTGLQPLSSAEVYQ
ncbi:MAG: kelch repeat-containing protein [Candidatus Sulfotelmatobacter sp.]